MSRLTTCLNIPMCQTAAPFDLSGITEAPLTLTLTLTKCDSRGAIMHSKRVALSRI